MIAPLNRTLGYLNIKFGYPFASAVVRALRVIGYGAAVWATTYVLANQDVLNVAPEYKFLVVALLMGIDKYLREHPEK